MDEPTALPAIATRDSWQVFDRFVRRFCDRFKDPALLDGVDARESHRRYVFHYFRKTFTEPRALEPRHLKWYRRLSPLLLLPTGSRVLDYGGGYGMDSILLAAWGFRVTLLEVSPHHIAIARRLAEDAAAALGPLDLRFVRTTISAERLPSEARGQDAVLLDEVAHHIEPPAALFRRCASALREGGSVFLLEPSFFNPLVQAYFLKVRGLELTRPMVDEETGAPYLYGNEHLRTRRRWIALARRAGLELAEATWVSPFAGSAHGLERVPVLRDVASSHVTLRFTKRTGAGSALP